MLEVLAPHPHQSTRSFPIPDLKNENRLDAHVDIAVAKGSYAFVIRECRPQKSTTIVVARRAGVPLPPGTDASTGTLLALRAATQRLNRLVGEHHKRGVAYRRIVFNTKSRTFACRARLVPQWRESGCYLTQHGEPLPREQEWRGFVKQLDGLPAHFRYAAKSSPARERIDALSETLRTARSKPPRGSNKAAPP
jgi:hypothetical protein